MRKECGNERRGQLGSGRGIGAGKGEKGWGKEDEGKGGGVGGKQAMKDGEAVENGMVERKGVKSGWRCRTKKLLHFYILHPTREIL